MGSTGLYAYWLFKTGELLEDITLQEAAMKCLLGYLAHGRNQEAYYFYDRLHLDGRPTENPAIATPWKIGYGESSLFSFARAVTYIAQKEGFSTYVELAKKCEEQIQKVPLAAEFTPQNIGEAINFYLDLHLLTDEARYLQSAKKYADIAMKQFLKQGLTLVIRRLYFDMQIAYSIGTLMMVILISCQPPSDTRENVADVSPEKLAEAMAAIEAAVPLAEKDPYRPIYHFRPPAQWMNDICGAFYYKHTFSR